MKFDFQPQLDVFHIYVHGRFKVGRSHYKLAKLSQKTKFWFFLFTRLLKPGNYRKVDKHGQADSSESNKLKGSKWIFYISRNNYHALNFLIPLYSDNQLVYDSSQAYDSNAINISKFLTVRSNLNRLRFLLYLYFSKHYTANYYDKIYRYYPYLEAYIKVLNEYQPQCIFIANDHHPRARSVLIAARIAGIKTFYFQHAAVTEVFPPLRFDSSFLFGQYSLDIYNKIEEIEGKTFLVGDQRVLMSDLQLNRNDEVNSIGVATNLLDEKHLIDELMEELIGLGVNIIFRKHPGDSRSHNFDSDKVKYSDARKETALEFLSKTDVLIAGDSSILLEAATLNVRPIYYKLGNKLPYDYYSFVKNDVVDLASTLTELKAQLELGREPTLMYRKRASYYDASIDLDSEHEFVDKIRKTLEHEFGIR